MLNTKLIKDAQKIVDQNRKTAEATAITEENNN